MIAKTWSRSEVLAHCIAAAELHANLSTGEQIPSELMQEMMDLFADALDVDEERAAEVAA